MISGDRITGTRSIKILLSLALLAIILASCTTKNHIRGKEFIHRDTLVNMLIDIHLIDGLTNDVKYYRFFDAGDSIDLYGPIFDKYEVTSEKFRVTMDEYSRYPEILDEVYDDVLMELNMMKDELGKKEDEPAIKPNISKGRSPRLRSDTTALRKKRELQQVENDRE